ncbi:hypothetical protein ACJW31_09G024300 [Castanea mollissima]
MANSTEALMAYCLLILDVAAEYISISFKPNIINHCKPSHIFYGAFQTFGLQLIFTPKGLLGTNYTPRIVLDTMN